MFVGHHQTEDILSDFRVRGVKFVGSTPAGKTIAEMAGKYMKRCSFELGGSDAFLVLDDADIDLAVDKAIMGRLVNNGQSCINSKRFIIDAKVYN